MRFAVPLERFHRARFVKVQYGIELIGESRMEVKADPFGLRPVDHADSSFQ
jgi:hypothetical protein